MEIRHRSKKMLSEEQKELEIMINQHKMLMNTLHEMFRRDNVSSKTLETLKAEIDGTLKAIEELRKKCENQSTMANTVSLFDSIKKDDSTCCSSNCTCGKHGSVLTKKTPVYEDNEHKEPGVDDILFCNRFITDLSDLLIPEYMVKSIDFINDDVIGVTIYDFMAETMGKQYPIMDILSHLEDRKFTMRITHVDATGTPVYQEKYVGCSLNNYFRGQLKYYVSEPSTISLEIKYDGVRYEAS